FLDGAAVAPESVLLDLLVGEEEIDPTVARNRLEPLERSADRLGLAVRDHGGPLDLSRLRDRSSFRAHPGSPASRVGRGGGRTLGSPSGRAGRSLRRPRAEPTTPSPPRRPREQRADGHRDRAPRHAAPPRARPRTAA